jgi:hypothetical protein
MGHYATYNAMVAIPTVNYPVHIVVNSLQPKPTSIATFVQVIADNDEYW